MNLVTIQRNTKIKLVTKMLNKPSTKDTCERSVKQFYANFPPDKKSKNNCQ